MAIVCTVICRASAIIYWEYSSLWRLCCYNWAVQCRHKHNLMKQPQLFKGDLYLQIQLHQQRIKAWCCPWWKAAWTLLLLKSWASFCWAGSPSIWTLSLPECWWLEPRGISSPAFKILEIVASLASTNPRDPCPCPELALFCTCKQTIINCKYWVCRSITCSSQR